MFMDNTNRLDVLLRYVHVHDIGKKQTDANAHLLSCHVLSGLALH